MDKQGKHYCMESGKLIYQMPKEVDHHVAKELSAELDRLKETYGIHEVKLDFSQTEFMDSSGIGVIIGRSKRMRFRSGVLLATGVGKRVDTILRSAGLYQLLKVE